MFKLPEMPPGSLWRKLYSTTHHCLACGANHPKETHMNLKPKPWWLRLVTPKDMWVTLKPNIYHPANVQPLESYSDQLDMVRRHEAVLAHEEVHIEQQTRYGLLRYLAHRYALVPGGAKYDGGIALGDILNIGGVHKGLIHTYLAHYFCIA